MKAMLQELSSPAGTAVGLRAVTGQPRLFLFLQGLPGPFFARLAEALSDGGVGVARILFNGGDEHDWARPGAIAWRGDMAGWPAFLAAQVEALGVTDVIMFNDARPLHAAAREVCNRLGITIHVFEDGYLRPNYITLEKGGVNRNSPLPRRLAEITAAARALPAAPPVTPVPATFRRRALDGLRYEFFKAIRASRYPGYRGHRPLSALDESKGWVRRVLRMSGEKRRTAAALAAIGTRPRFLFPLQLDADTQLRLYSAYGGMAPALEEVIASFARTSPADTVLLVKQHPLDPGLTDWRAKCRALAEAQGIAGRLVYIEGGDIHDILPGCLGLVTINSTTGMSALEHDVPVHVLGHAVYGIEGITAAGPLDGFWQQPGQVDRDAYQALRRLMLHQSLVHGGFHSDEGLALAVRNAAARLLADA